MLNHLDDGSLKLSFVEPAYLKPASLRPARMLESNSDFTSRLQKGGALLSDMRQLVCHWADKPQSLAPARFVKDVLPKSTHARANDTFIRSFHPRFIEGSPKNAWELCAVLEENHPTLEVARTFYYWLTARSEPVLYRYVTEALFQQAKTGISEVTSAEASEWIQKNQTERNRTWSDIVRIKVARGMLAALRDFGILSGSSRKSIAPLHLPLESFCLIAFCLRNVLGDHQDLTQHPDWRLFLLSPTAVERLLLEAHQHNWLHYQAAGAVSRLEFPAQTFEAYARIVLHG